MTIDWASFTPWTSLAGGLLIGLAASLLVLMNGRIAGISGVVGGLLRPRTGDTAWRAAFILGMLLAPGLYAWIWRIPQSEITTSTPLLVAAGLLVGIGTRFGSGCTSGHGVCGLARGSARSLVATLSFMLAGFITVFVTRHVIGG